MRPLLPEQIFLQNIFKRIFLQTFAKVYKLQIGINSFAELINLLFIYKGRSEVTYWISSHFMQWLDRRTGKASDTHLILQVAKLVQYFAEYLFTILILS